MKSATTDQPINLTFQIGSMKDVRTVRLHYRLVDSTESSVIEIPAAASMTFTIPEAASDLLYFFEITNRENSGWFEPDPDSAKPYHVVRVEQK